MSGKGEGKEPNPKDGATITETLSQLVGLVARMDIRLGMIEKQVLKIDGIQASMNSLTCKVNQLERDVQGMKEKNGEMEKSAEAISEFYDEVKKKSDKNSLDVAALQQRMDATDANRKGMETSLRTAQKSRDVLRDTVEDLQCRSMKNNLIFHGLRENDHEDTEGKLRDFIYYELDIGKDLALGNVHRIGKRAFGKNRPIIARFIYHNDWQLVKDSAHRLRGTHFGINEQFPAAVEDRRKLLYPIMKHKRRSGHRVKLVRDKLFIDGQLYVGNDDTDFTQERDVTPSRDNDDDSRSYSDVVVSPAAQQQTGKRPRLPSSPAPDTQQNNSPRSRMAHTPVPPPAEKRPRSTPGTGSNHPRSSRP